MPYFVVEEDELSQWGRVYGASSLPEALKEYTDAMDCGPSLRLVIIKGNVLPVRAQYTAEEED